MQNDMKIKTPPNLPLYPEMSSEMQLFIAEGYIFCVLSGGF